MADKRRDRVVRTREEILHALETFPSEFKRSIMQRADREALLRPAFDGGWGIVEILPHLADWEAIYLDRTRAVLADDNPALPGFDDTLWSIERDYRGQDPHESFARFSELRGQLLAILEKLTPEEWERTGVHGYYGDITLMWMANHICDHDEEHFEQAKDALTA